MSISGEVSVRETTIVIPTYYLKKDNPNPPLHKYFSFQVYPYSLHDNVSRAKIDIKYRAVIIENRYLRLTVLPERGGHIYSAFDKRNRKELFYVDKVLKPSLFACRGAWNYGGMEFNFPVAHNPNTLDRVMYTIKEEPDGTTGIVFGNIERLTRMSWQVGLYLHPRSSAVEQRVLLFNHSSLPAPYYFWTDAAFNATPTLNLVYPMKYFSLHGSENIYHRWPWYQGRDYRLLRNIREDISIFAGDLTERYFGAYDTNSRCAVVHVSDGTPQGKKLWTAGKCERGDAFAREFDVGPERRPLVEIQSGLFRTQNHFEILHPGQKVSWKEWWFQAIGFDNLLFSSSDLAVGGKMAGRRLFLQLCPIRPINGTLSVSCDDGGKKPLIREKVSITPETTLKKKIDLKSLPSEKFTVELKNEDGNTVLSCPLHLDDSAAVSISGPYEKKKDLPPNGYNYASLKELEKPILKMKSGLFAEARGILNNSSNSRAPDAVFYNALACYHEGSLTKALSILRKIGTKTPWAREAALLKIKIFLRNNNFKQAAAMGLALPAGLKENDPRACMLTAVAMRKCGDSAGSIKMIVKTRDKFPLYLSLVSELIFTSQTLGYKQEEKKCREILKNHLGKEVFLCHELILEYGAIGLWREITGLLDSLAVPSDPVGECLRAYAFSRCGEDGAALGILKRIEGMPFDYVFPSQTELFEILSWAINRYPKSIKLRYAIGTLCYARGRFKEAQQHWENAYRKGFKHSVLFRNLGLLYAEILGDDQKAIRILEEGLNAQPPNGSIFMLLDRCYKKTGRTEKRRNLLKYQNRFPDKDYIVRPVINIYLDMGQFDKAVRLLHRYDFTNWETDDNEEIGPDLSLHTLFYSAHIKRGRHFLEVGKPGKALADFKALLRYPQNFPTGRNENYFAGDIFYYHGLAFERMGKTKQAYKYFVKALMEEEKCLNDDQKKIVGLAQGKVLSYGTWKKASSDNN